MAADTCAEVPCAGYHHIVSPKQRRHPDGKQIVLGKRLSGVRKNGKNNLALVDFIARTSWFFHVEPEFKGWSIVLVISTIFTLLTLKFDDPTIGIVTAALAAASVLQSLREWLKKARHSDRLKLMPESPSRLATSYEGDYQNWRVVGEPKLLRWLALGENNSTIGGGASWHHVITQMQLNAQLRHNRRVDVDIAEGIDSQWVPGDPAYEIWKQWGGRRYNRSELKIRLASDLLPDSRKVTVQTTDYNAYIVTNNLALEQINEQTERGDRPVLTFADVGLHCGRIRELHTSRLSNHLGGDLLLVEPGEVKIQLHSRYNKVFPENWAASASGSFDHADLLKKGDNLTDLVKRALARELHEEMRPLNERETKWRRERPRVEPDDVIITGYSRATYTGGKPQFYGVARSPERLIDPDEVYVRSFRSLEFSTAEGGKSLVAALKKFLSENYAQASPSLIYSVWMLDDWLSTDSRGAESWLGKYWHQ